MNPPRDAQQARCGACQQTVETAKLHTTESDLLMLVCCPHCGVVWGVVRVPARRERD